MSLHSEHAERAGVSTPCASWHTTFGGRCLNCGYIPADTVVAPAKTIWDDDGPYDPCRAGGLYEPLMGE